mmetsp:Transcript_34156/g.67226  ORF Transcript_34156/g.67226 Transcript_34156/m.67226 type:complete len:293 (-) Transcript_34156:316-1194(-)
MIMQERLCRSMFAAAEPPSLSCSIDSNLPASSNQLRGSTKDIFGPSKRWTQDTCQNDLLSMLEAAEIRTATPNDNLRPAVDMPCTTCFKEELLKTVLGNGVHTHKANATACEVWMEKDKVVTPALLPISLSPQRKQQESSFLREDVYSVGSHSGLRKTREAMTAMVAVGDNEREVQEVTPQLRVPFHNMDFDEKGEAFPAEGTSYVQQQVLGVWWSRRKRRNPRVRVPSNLPIVPRCFRTNNSNGGGQSSLWTIMEEEAFVSSTSDKDDNISTCAEREDSEDDNDMIDDPTG